MSRNSKNVLIVGGGTAGSVMAARLSENPDYSVTLLEMGETDRAYDAAVLDPPNAPNGWLGGPNLKSTVMSGETNDILVVQGRMLGGTSAVNGMATLRGLPADYDDWEAKGLEGWGWRDVESTFIAAENDLDFGATPIHGDKGPLSVRRWRREEISRAQLAFYDGMAEVGARRVTDINDPSQLPGIGVFPVTIGANGKRMTTSLAYLTEAVRARDNLNVRTGAEVVELKVDTGRVIGVTLATGEEIEADEVVVCAGALWTPHLLMRSGIGPAKHLADHNVHVHADLPVGETMSDHLGPGIRYGHAGPRGGSAGPAQVLLIGASNGKDVDSHIFPIAQSLADGPTEFMMAAFLLRSSGLGSVRLAESVDADPIVTAPPLPDDGVARLRHAFDRIVEWEKSGPARALGCEQLEPLDLGSDTAVTDALERLTISYGHMTSTCPMGKVLDANCRVVGLDGLRVADASVMPTIPSGNTYLGCVMVAERIAIKMLAEFEA